MKAKLGEFESDESLGEKITRSGLSGRTLAYALSILEGESFTLCDYSVTPIITCGPKEDPKETRAYREMLRTRGKKLPRIEESALRDELIILPGAAMSPADVVRALENFINHVKRDGMNIGKYQDDFIRERVSGKPRFVSELGLPLRR